MDTGRQRCRVQANRIIWRRKGTLSCGHGPAGITDMSGSYRQMSSKADDVDERAGVMQLCHAGSGYLCNAGLAARGKVIADVGLVSENPRSARWRPAIASYRFGIKLECAVSAPQRRFYYRGVSGLNELLRNRSGDMNLHLLEACRNAGIVVQHLPSRDSRSITVIVAARPQPCNKWTVFAIGDDENPVNDGNEFNQRLCLPDFCSNQTGRNYQASSVLPACHVSWLVSQRTFRYDRGFLSQFCCEGQH